MEKLLPEIMTLRYKLKQKYILRSIRNNREKTNAQKKIQTSKEAKSW